MNKRILLILGFWLAIVPAYADPVPSVLLEETLFQGELHARYETYGRPKATCYYDDLVDHYEHDELMQDTIAQGLN